MLEGITVGGHKLTDQQITTNQGEAWRALFTWIKEDPFEVNAKKACELHSIAGKEEALEWGQFHSGGVIASSVNLVYRDYHSSILQMTPNFKRFNINSSNQII